MDFSEFFLKINIFSTDLVNKSGQIAQMPFRTYPNKSITDVVMTKIPLVCVN